MMNEMKTGTFTYKDEMHNFDFKTSLSAYDKQMFVKTVVHNLVDDEGYEVVIKDLIFDFTIVELFTNIDTSFIEMKDDEGNDINSIILIEHFLENTNVVDIVKANMEIGLLEELSRAVDLNIQYLTGININPLSESIANLVSTLEKKINEFDLDEMMDVAQKFVGMTKDITPESFVDAYIASNMHGDNSEKTEEVKDE